MGGIPKHSLGRRKRALNESEAVEDYLENTFSENDSYLLANEQSTTAKADKKVIKSRVGSLIFTVVDHLPESKPKEESSWGENRLRSKFDQNNLDSHQNLERLQHMHDSGWFAFQF